MAGGAGGAGADLFEPRIFDHEALGSPPLQMPPGAFQIAHGSIGLSQRVVHDGCVGLELEDAPEAPGGLFGIPLLQLQLPQLEESTGMIGLQLQRPL